MDLNKDSNIDRKELKNWILRSFRMLSVEESDSRFEDADENSDGQVDWDEHLKETYGSEDSEQMDVASLGDDEVSEKLDVKMINFNHRFFFFFFQETVKEEETGSFFYQKKCSIICNLIST